MGLLFILIGYILFRKRRECLDMATNHIAPSVDLGALFDIQIDGAAVAVDPSAWATIKCRKCGGGGKFIGYTGRAVGDCFACKGSGVHMKAADEPDTSTGIDANKIAAAFQHARARGIKRPKMTIDAFRFALAPNTGKNPGAIYVQASGTYIGKIDASQFHPTRSCHAETTAQLVTVAADPGAAAKAYGLRTGQCSCCGRALTNGVSIDLGIGPICAEKYGF